MSLKIKIIHFRCSSGDYTKCPCGDFNCDNGHVPLNEEERYKNVPSSILHLHYEVLSEVTAHGGPTSFADYPKNSFSFKSKMYELRVGKEKLRPQQLILSSHACCAMYPQFLSKREEERIFHQGKLNEAKEKIVASGLFTASEVVTYYLSAKGYFLDEKGLLVFPVLKTPTPVTLGQGAQKKLTSLDYTSY